MTAIRFRVLVIAWAFIYAWWAALPLTAYKQPGNVLAALEHAGSGAVIPFTETFANLLLLATLGSAVGLVIFRHWGRVLLLGTTGVALVHAPFAGVMIAGPVDGTLGFLVTLMTGALAAIVFYSPVAERFLKRAAPEIEEGIEPAGPHLPDENLVTVFETSDPAIIPVIDSVLRSAGIEFTTTSEQLQDLIAGGRLAGYNQAVGSVRFLVRDSDAVFARDVLQLASE